MKVDNKPSVRSGSVRAGRPAEAGKPAFAAALTERPRAGGVSGGVPIGAAAAIVALQEMADPGEGRRRAARRGNRLLDLLDELRVGLLTGGFSTQTLGELSHLAAQAREHIDSPALQEVLDEIDLRVQVELAKYDGR